MTNNGGVSSSWPSDHYGNATGYKTVNGLNKTICYYFWVAGKYPPDIGLETINTIYNDYDEPLVLSNKISVIFPPEVGDIITKTQMDNLRAYKNNTPTAVTQYDTIKASIGNTYKNNLTQGTKLTADWFNSV